MNKTSKIVSIILVIVAIIIIVSISQSGKNTKFTTNSDKESVSTSSYISVPVSETKKVSSSLSQYQNSELGFSLKYPNNWEKEEGNAGVNFVLSIDKTQTSTVASVNISVQVMPSNCAFPPVTTIKDKSTLKVGENNFNMISMSNTVKGLNYFNRMYSLQKDKICYMFSFASITYDPSTKGLTGSNITVAQNNNKAIVTDADSAFTEMVKSFTFIVGPQGEDETKASPKR